MEVSLIILYGKVSENYNSKQQAMIDGDCSCMYREFAKNYGEITYLQLQDVYKEWENTLSIEEAIAEIKKHPNVIVWSVKHDPQKDRILNAVDNRKIYYSCNNQHSICDTVDYSLVDTEERLRGNARLWCKGKDNFFWRPMEGIAKEYDYCLVGRRADKNEHYFIEKLAQYGAERRVLWIGGEEHRRDYGGKVIVDYTPFVGPRDVRDAMCRCKVGVLYSEHPTEGYPQSHLEMSLCGLPVVYGGPVNKLYIGTHNIIPCESKEKLIDTAENTLGRWDRSTIWNARGDAVQRYSLEAAWRRINALFGN